MVWFGWLEFSGRARAAAADLQFHGLFLVSLHSLPQLGDAVLDSDNQSDFLQIENKYEVNSYHKINNEETHVGLIAGGVSPQPDHVAGDAQHRGQGGEPAERVRPQRVRVAEVLDRGPLHDVEDEHTLCWLCLFDTKK